MPTWHGNAFPIIVLVWGKSFGYRWIPLTKTQWCVCFLCYMPSQTFEQSVDLPVIRDACKGNYLLLHQRTVHIISPSKRNNFQWKRCLITGHLSVMHLDLRKIDCFLSTYALPNNKRIKSFFKSNVSVVNFASKVSTTKKIWTSARQM